MSTFLNLDKVVPPDKKVKLGGKEWVIPAQTPVGVMMKMLRANEKLQKDETDPDAIMETVMCLHTMFKIKQPDLELEDFENMLSAEQIFKLTAFLYQEAPDEVIEGKQNGSSEKSAKKAQPTPQQ